jgi:hypothetical protein
LEIKMRPAGVSGIAQLANYLALLDLAAGLDRDAARLQMRIDGPGEI